MFEKMLCKGCERVVTTVKCNQSILKIFHNIVMAIIARSIPEISVCVCVCVHRRGLHGDCACLEFSLIYNETSIDNCYTIGIYRLQSSKHLLHVHRFTTNYFSLHERFHTYCPTPGLDLNVRLSAKMGNISK